MSRFEPSPRTPSGRQPLIGLRFQSAARRSTLRKLTSVTLVLSILLSSLLLARPVEAATYNVTLSANFSSSLGSYLRPEIDNNMHGKSSIIDTDQAQKLKDINTRVMRKFQRVDSFYPDPNVRQLVSWNTHIPTMVEWHQMQDYADAILWVIKATPPALGENENFNYDAFEADLKTILTNLKQNFSKLEYVDAWNEPDHTDPFEGVPNGSDTLANYLLIYDRVESAVKYVNSNVSNGPTIKIAGPTTTSASETWIKGLLDHAKNNNKQLDYIAWHSYNTTYSGTKTNVQNIKTWIADRSMSTKVMINEYGTLLSSISAGNYAKHAAVTADIGFAAVDGGIDVLNNWVLEDINDYTLGQFLFNYQQSNSATGWQTFDFTDRSARYVRLVTYENSANADTKINELRIKNGAGTTLSATILRSTPAAANLIDGSTSTTWTASQSGWTVGEAIFDLGSSQTVGSTEISWGGTNTYRFEIFLSADSVNWTRAHGSAIPLPQWHVMTMQSRLKDTRVSATTNNSNVQLWATKTDDAVAIMAWSRNDSDSYNVTLNLSNMPSAFSGKAIQYQRSLVDATTSNYGYSTTNYDLATVNDSVLSAGTSSLSFTLNKNAITLIELAPTEQIPTSSLAGYWKFDETSNTTASDSSGNGKDGTVSGATWTTSGKSNGALDFDGVDDYVSLPNIVNPSSTNFTAMAWVNLDTERGSYQVILQQEGGSGRTWLGRKSNDTLYTFIGSSELTSSTSLALNTWYHVAVVKNGSTITLYINGQGAGSATRTAESETSGMLVGKHKAPSTTLEEWDGKIDQVRLYNSALSQSQIGAIYDAGN